MANSISVAVGDRLTMACGTSSPVVSGVVSDTVVAGDVVSGDVVSDTVVSGAAVSDDELESSPHAAAVSSERRRVRQWN